MGKVSGVVLLSINTGNVKLDPQFKCYLQLSSFSLCLLKVSRDSGTARTGGFQIGFNGFRPPNKNLKNRFWQEKKNQATMVHAWNPSTQEMEPRKSRPQGQ